MDKKQKKEFREVLKKYKHGYFDVAKSYLRSASVGAVTAIALDLVATGGIGTGTAVIAALFPLSKGIRRTAMRLSLTQDDQRPQQIRARPDVLMVLGKIQMNLSRSFRMASQVIENPSPTELEISQRAKKDFLKEIDEAEKDIKKLSPGFKIVSGGRENYGKEKFELLVKNDPNASLWETSLYTLDEIRTKIRAQMELEANPKTKPEAPAAIKRSRLNP